jgi:adenylate cyclase
LPVVGRLINLTGGAVASKDPATAKPIARVVDALDCAVKIQDALAVANESAEPQHRLLFRIGVNVGDVMLKDGDIFGDGVNIAARLESLADAGGICVSRGVRDHVRKMGQYAFEDLGEQSVKNIAQPIRAFRVRSAKMSTQEVADMANSVSASTPAEQHADDPAEFELAFWDAMKESNDPAEFTSYLEQYPRGAFVTLAEARRQALLAPEAPPAPAKVESDLVAVELAFWNTMKDSDNPAMYEAYLERYPDGAFAPLAKVKLTEVRPSLATYLSRDATSILACLRGAREGDRQQPRVLIGRAP